ncbi:MFS transporter [Actinoplanes sp. NPDC051470]|uniref:MFS transporter n=1 Tax=Actinoplanes sp. NPDC051470 TaxID=3157224 RepID=UPI0034240DBE
MTSRRDGAVVGLACTVQFVDVIGVTLLVVALPTVQHDLGLSAAMLSWVAGGYALVFGGLLVPGGWVVDLVGRRAAFLAGSAVVAAGSAVCTVAGGGGALLAGRAIQGAGAAVAVPAALALVLVTTPEGARRRRALGLWTVAGAVGGASGFVLGGVVTEYVGWRWLFAAVAVLEVIAVAITPLLVGPSDRRAAASRTAAISGGPAMSRGAGSSRGAGILRGAAGSRAVGAGVAGRLDLGGAGLAVVAVVALVWSLNHGLGSPVSWAGLLVAAAAGIAFGVLERRVTVPMVPPWVWRMSSFRLGAGTAVVLTATTSGASVVGTLFLQDGLGLSGAASGACFVLLSGGVVVSSALAPAALRRIGPRRAMVTGFVVIAASLATEALSVGRTSLAGFMIGLAGSGLGLGLASVASTAHGTAEATDDTSGLIGGLLTAAAQIGTAIGIALLLTATTDWATAFLLAAATAVLAAMACALADIRAGAGRGVRRPGGSRGQR